VIVSIFFSAISFCGSSFIVITYLRYPMLRSFIFQLVVWISASDIMYSIGNAIGNPSDGSAACYVQAVFIEFFGMSSALWTACIAYVVDRVYLKGRQLGEATSLKRGFHIFVWGLSALLTILPATTGNYGPSTGWCWIDVSSNPTAGTAWRFICFYLPLWAVVGYNLSVYIKVNRALNEAGAGDGGNANIRQIQRMIYYPLVLVICYIFGTISRIQQLFGPPVYGLVILHTIGMSSQGTLNAIVYGLTPSVKNLLFGKHRALDEPAIGEEHDDVDELPHEDRSDLSPENARNVKATDKGLVSVNLESKANVLK